MSASVCKMLYKFMKNIYFQKSSQIFSQTRRCSYWIWWVFWIISRHLFTFSFTTVSLANSRFLQAVKSTTNRANSSTSWRFSRQRMIKRARSAEVGSLKHLDGISNMSFGLSMQSDETWTWESASWNLRRQAFPTGHENTEIQCHSEYSHNCYDRAQQKRQARLWLSDSRKAGKELQRVLWALTRPKAPIPLKKRVSSQKEAMATVAGWGKIETVRGRQWERGSSLLPAERVQGSSRTMCNM